MGGRVGHGPPHSSIREALDVLQNQGPDSTKNPRSVLKDPSASEQRGSGAPRTGTQPTRMPPGRTRGRSPAHPGMLDLLTRADSSLPWARGVAWVQRRRPDVTSVTTVPHGHRFFHIKTSASAGCYLWSLTPVSHADHHSAASLVRARGGWVFFPVKKHMLPATITSAPRSEPAPHGPSASLLLLGEHRYSSYLDRSGAQGWTHRRLFPAQPHWRGFILSCAGFPAP